MKEMDSQKLTSDLLYIKAIDIGNAQITVKIEEKGYEEIGPASVQLTVAVPFIVIPEHPVYVLPASEY